MSPVELEDLEAAVIGLAQVVGALASGLSQGGTVNRAFVASTLASVKTDLSRFTADTAAAKVLRVLGG